LEVDSPKADDEAENRHYDDQNPRVSKQAPHHPKLPVHSISISRFAFLITYFYTALAQ
jgi:hypothetical protein